MSNDRKQRVKSQAVSLFISEVRVLCIRELVKWLHDQYLEKGRKEKEHNHKL